MVGPGPHKMSSLAKLVMALGALLIVAGVMRHGLTIKNILRLWQNLVDRPGSAMSFRFVLQPSMAVIAAIHDGLEDARSGRSPYFWTVLRAPEERVQRLNEGLNATAKIILLGIAMDVIYQVMVFSEFYPGEAVVIALLLAFVPYLIGRGLVARAWGSGVRMDAPTKLQNGHRE